jgi:hypothetical protein
VRVVAVLAVVAVAGAVAQAPTNAAESLAPNKGRPGAPPSGPPLGVVRTSAGPQLSRLDPLTLEPVGSKADLGRSVTTWAFMPGGGRLVVGSDRAVVRFVDVSEMRVLGDVALAEQGRVTMLAWLWPKYVIAVYARRGHAAEVAWIDPVARRVVQRRALDVMPWTLAQGWNEVALLLAPLRSIGGARVAIADDKWRLRIVRVSRIEIGSDVPLRLRRDGFRRIAPGLALDPTLRRVYVAGTGGITAEIELSSLAVSYHSHEHRRTISAATARTKTIEGADLRATWVTNGVIAVSGTRYTVTRNGTHTRQTSAPAGLQLLDTRRWTQRMLDERASGFTLAGDTILAVGLRASSGGEAWTYSGMGVAAFGVDGTRRFGILEDDAFWSVQATATHAYARRYATSSPSHIAVVDLRSATVEQDLVATQTPRLLLGEPPYVY